MTNRVGARPRRHPCATLADLAVNYVHDDRAAELLERWQDIDAVLLVDGVSSGERPGTIRRLDASSAPVAPSLSRGSSHAISVADAIELARALGRLPARVIVYGIVGATFAARAGLSQEVAAALDGLVAAVRVEALALGGADGPAVT
jgi:hydrogenase maturation protease